MATVWIAGAAAFEAEAAGADEAGAEDAVGVVGAAAFVTVWATGAAAVLAGAAGAGDAGAEEVGAAGAEAAGAEAAGVAVTLATGWVTGAAAFVTGAVAVETALPRSSPEAALALPSPTSRIVSSSKAKTASSPALLVVLLDTPAKPIRSPLPPARIDQTSLDLKTGRSENPVQAQRNSIRRYLYGRFLVGKTRLRSPRGRR